MDFVSFFLVLLAAMFFSTVFNRLHLPWVAALLLGGLVIGPSGLDWFTPDTTMRFLGEIGLIFLMFMAGLETRLSSFKTVFKNSVVVAIINSALPFVIGFSIGLYFGYGYLVSALIGTIFISSSIAVVVPPLEASGLMHFRLGKSIIASTIIQDIASLLLLSILLQSVNPVARLPLPLFYILLVVSLVVLRLAIPKIWQYTKKNWYKSGRELFAQDLEFTLTILIGTVVIFQLLGLHAIIAGFFAGLVLSESIESEIFMEKLRAVSYGLFIPIFFIIIGSQTDIGQFVNSSEAILLTAVVVAGSVIAKFSSGFLGSRLIGFKNRESAIFGFSTVPQLSTTLAAVTAGLSFGLLDQKIATAMVVLTIVTTFIAPLAVSKLSSKLKHIRAEP